MLGFATLFMQVVLSIPCCRFHTLFKSGICEDPDEALFRILRGRDLVHLVESLVYISTYNLSWGSRILTPFMDKLCLMLFCQPFAEVEV